MSEENEQTIAKSNTLDTKDEPLPERRGGNPLCSCGEPRIRGEKFCHHCGQDFRDSPSFEVKEEPIVDEDGTTHSGRRIRLIGEGWPNDLRMIKDMTDDELEGQIKGLQELLKNAIQTGEYARISIAAREFELGYRKHSRYISAMKRREKLTKQGTLRLGQKQFRQNAKQQIPAHIAALMKVGLTYEQAVQLAATLGKAKS